MTLPFYVLSAMAQDMLVTNEGKSMTIYNLEISDQSIFFQLSNKADAPLQKMLKKDVLIIKKADGTKLDLDAPQAEETNQVVQPAEQKESGTVYVTPETLSPEAKAANDALIAKYNQPIKYKLIKEKNKGKKANFGIAVFGLKENSVISNEDIEIIITKGGIQERGKKKPKVFIPKEKIFSESTTLVQSALQFSIKNKTNQTIYLDLGNTFYTSMEQSICFYVPTSTTTTASSSGGGSVNLGAVAGALGVGGAVGTIANGVNVGGGSTNGTSTTTYSQRIIPIAPMGKTTLDAQYMFGKDIFSPCQGMQCHTSSTEFIFSDENNILTGDHYIYDKTTSPINLSFIIAYSHTEDCRLLKTQTVYLYLKDLYGDKINPLLIYDTESFLEHNIHNIYMPNSIRHTSKIAPFPKP